MKTHARYADGSTFDPIAAVQDIRSLVSKVTGEGKSSPQFMLALVTLGNLVNGYGNIDDAIDAFEDLRDETI
jgi:hypothetical protein